MWKTVHQIFVKRKLIAYQFKSKKISLNIQRMISIKSDIKGAFCGSF